MSLHPKDPRITAYALGELSDNEAREVEQFLATSPAAREEVEAIRTFTGRLRSEFAAQPVASASAGKSPFNKSVVFAVASLVLVAGLSVLWNLEKADDVSPVQSGGAPEPMRTVKVVVDPPAGKTVALGELRSYKVDIGGRTASIPPELNRIQLYNFFWERQPALTECYNREREKSNTRTGEVHLAFEISAKGEVLNLKTTRNTLRNEALAACVERELKAQNFPPPANGQKSRTVLYPLIFVQE